MQHSEYQKRFRPIGPSQVESHYAQLLAYRRARRSTEASHHRWAWQDSASDSESKEERPTDLSDVEEEPEKARVAKRLSRSPQRNGISQQNGVLTASEDEEEEEEEEEDEEEEVAARLKRLALRRALEKEREGGRSQKPRHPKNRAAIPKPLKSKGAPQESSQSCGKPRENPMFVLYGSGNREDRGTFNVRSDRDVHASAVRANRRRLSEIERRRHAKLVKPARERRTGKDPAKDLASMKMQRETAAWQSEYQKNFPTYEMACYRRSLANLTPRPVSAAI